MKLFLVITLIILSLFTTQQEQLVDIQNIRPLLVNAIVDTCPEYDTGNANRLLGQVTPHLLSPDGTTIVAFADLRRADATRQQDELICLYLLDSETITCYPRPQQFDYTIRTAPTRIMAWSPDGTKIALYEDYYEGRQESDLWLFDVATGAFTNITDDNVAGNYSDALASNLPFTIDYAPIWNPVNGDLYFIRLRGEVEIGLYRLASDSTVPEPVTDLSDFRSFGLVDISPVSLASISPDGTQLAFAPLSFMEEKIGVWLVDLNTGELTQLITIDDLKTTMPEWLASASRFINIREVVWHDSRIIVMVEALTFAINLMNYYSIDVNTGEITRLLNFSRYENMDDFLRDSLATLLPRPVGIVSGDNFYLLHLEQTHKGINPVISVTPLTFDAPLTKVADISLEAVLYPPEYFPSTYKFLYTSAPDGRVLVGNFIMEFE